MKEREGGMEGRGREGGRRREEERKGERAYDAAEAVEVIHRA